MRDDAVPDLVARVARRRGGGGRGPRLRRRSWSRSPGWWTATSGATACPARAAPDALEAAPLRRGNFMARMRMAVLYDRSVTWRGLVVGTGNKTESLIGYTTLFGDSACAFNPIGDLYKSQVRQLSAAIGVPEAIIRKAPSADLWPGQTDETEAGFSYPELDRLLFWRIDKRRSRRGAGRDGLRPRDGRARRPDGRGRRVQAPGAADREARAADRGRGLPLPAATARARRRGPDGGRARRAVATPAGGTLYVVATPIGNLGDVTLRALEVLRAVPLIAAEDTRITRRLLDRYEIATRTTSYHAQSGPARERELLAHLAVGRGPRARHRRRHARRLRPGRGAGGGVGRGRRARSSRSPGRRRCWRPWRRRGSRGRAGRSRGSCRAAGASDGAAGAASPPTSGAASLFEAPGRTAATLRDLAAACGADRPGAVCRELTKLHEQVVRGPLGELAGLARGRDDPRARRDRDRGRLGERRRDRGGWSQDAAGGRTGGEARTRRGGRARAAVQRLRGRGGPRRGAGERRDGVRAGRPGDARRRAAVRRPSASDDADPPGIAARTGAM